MSKKNCDQDDQKEAVVTSQWTHDFLNKKPWHPMNYQNRAKVWQAQQAHAEEERRNILARQEFEAEQEKMKTFSMLSTEEQEKYKQRESISWLYQKPPGLPKIAADGDAARTGDTQQVGETEHTQRNKKRSSSAITNVVSGIKAIIKQQEYQNFELKRSGGKSPPRGGIHPLAENQQFVISEIDSEEEEAIYKNAMMSPEEKKRLHVEKQKERKRMKKELAQRKIEEAKEFLRSAGLCIPEDDGDEDDSEHSDDSSSDDSSDDSDGEGGKQGRKNRDDRKRKRKRKNAIVSR